MTANNMYHCRTYAESALEDGISPATYDQLCTVIPDIKVSNRLLRRAAVPVIWKDTLQVSNYSKANFV